MPGGDPCYDGQCIATCPTDVPQATDCAGTCTDLGSDYYNCGACGNSCGTVGDSGRTCSKGQCSTTCGGTICPPPPPHATTACQLQINAPTLPAVPGEVCGFVCDRGYQPSRDGRTCDLIVTCTPRTPAAACERKDCGTVSDGCGGTIDCGACPPLSICGLTARNVCSAVLR